jgi:hypothetical protein
MKRALWVVCCAVLLTVGLTVPAQSRPHWQSNLVCDVNGDEVFTDLFGRPEGTPYAQITGSRFDLYVSKIYLPDIAPHTPVSCEVFCGFPELAVGHVDARTGTIPCGETQDFRPGISTFGPVLLPRFASKLQLRPPEGACEGVRLFISVPGRVLCVDGFVDP